MQWLDEDFADACDFELLGLSSHLPPHRLAWELNQHLEWRLEFFKVLEIQQRKGIRSMRFTDTKTPQVTAHKRGTSLKTKPQTA